MPNGSTANAHQVFHGDASGIEPIKCFADALRLNHKFTSEDALNLCKKTESAVGPVKCYRNATRYGEKLSHEDAISLCTLTFFDNEPTQCLRKSKRNFPALTQKQRIELCSGANDSNATLNCLKSLTAELFIDFESGSSYCRQAPRSNRLENCLKAADRFEKLNGSERLKLCEHNKN